MKKLFLLLTVLCCTMVANATVTVDDIKAAMGNNVYVNINNESMHEIRLYPNGGNGFLYLRKYRILNDYFITNTSEDNGTVTMDFEYDSGSAHREYQFKFIIENDVVTEIELVSKNDTDCDIRKGTYKLYNPGYIVINGCTEERFHLYMGAYTFAEFKKKNDQIAEFVNGSFYSAAPNEWGETPFDCSHCEVGKVYHVKYIQEDEYWGYDVLETCDKAYLKSTYDLNVSSVGWASLYYDRPLTIPSGVKAYYASSIDGTTVTLTEITGAIPANTGVIVQAAEGTLTFPIAVTAAPVSGNLFAGVTEETANPGNVYVLSPMTTTDKPMFQNYTGAALGAYKAYLPAAGAGDVLNFVFDDASSISHIDTAVPSKVRYNLNGQAVGANYKGIVIVNGKKYINK